MNISPMRAADVLRDPDRDAAAHDHRQRLLEGLRDDRLAARLCRSAGCPSPPPWRRSRAPSRPGRMPSCRRRRWWHLPAGGATSRRCGRLPPPARSGDAHARRHRGLRFVPPPGSFYAFPDISALIPARHGGQRIDTVDQLCDWLLDVHGVAVVPGSSFGDAGCFRISFAASDEALAEGLSRIARALATLDRASRRARNAGP